MGNRLVAYEAIGWFRGQQTVVLSLSLVSFTSYICMYGYNTSIQKTKEKKCCSCLFWSKQIAFRPMVVCDRRAVGGSITQKGRFVLL